MQERNILTVDFDKFLNLDIDADGRLIDGKASERPRYSDSVLWLRRYYHNPELLKAGIEEEDEKLCLSLLFKQLADVPVYVSDSHRYLIKFLIDVIERMHLPGVVYNVFNVDNHHDIYFLEPPDMRMPPGSNNWVYHMHANKKLRQYTWIRNENSLSFAGEKPFEFVETMSYEVLRGVKFDGIHICKSSPWLPPHLHPRFEAFVNALKCHFNEFFYSDEQNVKNEDLTPQEICEAVELVNRVKWL